MNDPIKYLITGAVIAIVCGAAGTMGGVWLMKEMGSGQRSEVRGQRTDVRGQKSGISIQSPVTSGQSSVFSGQRMPQNPVITIPPRASNGSNFAVRPTLPTGKMPISYSQFQKAQELPEVKAAREAFMEAQKRYSETLKKAMGAGTEVRNQKSEVSGQKTGGSGQTAGK